MIFLATPYSDEKLSVMQRRYEEALEMTSYLAKQGFILYAPIVSWHVVAVKYNLPFDYNYWKMNSRAFIDCCDTFAIGKIEGWDKSEGVREEYHYAVFGCRNIITVEPLHSPDTIFNYRVEELEQDTNPFPKG